MLSCFLRRDPNSDVLKRSILSVANYVLQHHCEKTESVSSRLPDNVPLLKPLKKASSSASLRIKTINKAMKAYLERAQNYDSFLKIKNTEYEIGRNHLANIMGLDSNNFTQSDINKAIEYLFPSGLYEPKARPLMKAPAEMYPREKAAQFDASGRPYNCFFYTRKTNFFASLHHIVEKFHELDEFEDRMIAQGILAPPADSQLTLSGGQWFTLEEIKNLFLENISEEDHRFLIVTLNRLINHPYSFRCKDELWKFRKEYPDMGALEDIPKLMTDENGRAFMEAKGFRKQSIANVIVRGNGTGKVSINGTDITFFERLHDREQLLYPLQFTGLLGKVDFEADVQGHGGKAMAGAIRYGLSLCLRSFLPFNEVEKMRLAGLLTHDTRYRGRKIYGQKGIRAKYTWKKR